MDETTYDEAEAALRIVEESLAQAIEEAREFARLMEDLDRSLAGRAELYLIGHLESWLENERQIGSVPDLRKDLEKLYLEISEDPDEDGDYGL